MDWVAIGKMIAPLAPTLGGIVGGLLPIPAGSFIGRQAGEILAAALGVPNNPEDIATAITNDPDAPNKIAAAEAEAASKWQGLSEMAKALYQGNTDQSIAINRTIQAETEAKVPWWHWRHLLGYLVLLYGIEQVAAIAYTMFGKGVPPDQLASLFNATGIFTAGLFALLGYIANDTTALKQTALTGKVPEGVVKTAIKAIKGK